MRDASAVITKKLYEEDAYRTEFDAVLVSVRRKEDSVLDVVLDQTCFFPEEGGQCPDRGELGGLSVLDVQIEGNEIHHYLEAPEDALPEAGAGIHGKIDWPFRFSNMQQHSGEHLFSGTVHRRYGFENVGFHLSPSEVTLDFDGVIPEQDIPELEREVNAAIWSNIPSVVRMTQREDREGLTYRSKIDLEGEVRIVTFPGIDSCACCAPHVARTGEIGICKVVSMIRWKGGVRVSILCGKRALEHFQKLHGIVVQTANDLSTSMENIFPQVVKLKNERQQLLARLKDASLKELQYAAKEIASDEEHALLFSSGAELPAVRKVVNALCAEHPGYCGVFVGNDEEGYSFVIGSRQLDCAGLGRQLQETLGSKGGGRPEMIQGSVARKREEIEGAIFSLTRP